ncbi:MAG: type II toxin-antitoxin system RelE/ParE family toxin [Syntrophotalea sp.]|uniref:type II toxin-antitoxin system RelE/ParE family toxin n=1 Tax=Syntrophotalea sp. TaxID=2812029 RepID=UPI003D12D7E2
MRIRWLRRRAVRDLDAAEKFIAQDNSEAAAKVALTIVKAVSQLKDQPGTGRAGRVPGTRELVIAETPYIVPYRVKNDVVEILRVYHSARKWPDGF